MTAFLSSATTANLQQTALIVFGANAAGFAITAATKSHKIIDLVGVGSFVLATAAMATDSLPLASLPWKDLLDYRLAWINAGVMLWGSRLSSFLFYRVLSLGHDERLKKFFPEPQEPLLDRKRSCYPLYLGLFWAIQGLWGTLCMLPVTLVNAAGRGGHNSLSYSAEALGKTLVERGQMPICARKAMGWVGMAITALPLVGIYSGIIIEAVADYQKHQFHKEGKGKWCNQGLWSWSQYPNYFGELLTWWSIYAASLPVLVSGPSPITTSLLGLVSPSFITFLLLRLSGVPLIEKKREKELKDNADYQQYKRQTSFLLPWPPSPVSETEIEKKNQ